MFFLFQKESYIRSLLLVSIDAFLVISKLFCCGGGGGGNGSFKIVSFITLTN